MARDSSVATSATEEVVTPGSARDLLRSTLNAMNVLQTPFKATDTFEDDHGHDDSVHIEHGLASASVGRAVYEVRREVDQRKHCSARLRCTLGFQQRWHRTAAERVPGLTPSSAHQRCLGCRSCASARRASSGGSTSSGGTCCAATGCCRATCGASIRRSA